MCIMLFCEKTLWQTKNFQSVCSCHHQDGVQLNTIWQLTCHPPTFLQRQDEMQTPLHCVLAQTVQKAITFAVLCTKGKTTLSYFCTQRHKNTNPLSYFRPQRGKIQNPLSHFRPQRGKNKKYLSKEKTKNEKNKERLHTC